MEDKKPLEQNVWITLPIVNLCIVALLGLLLRSKILFPIPIIDFNDLAEAHEHFAFNGWVTFTLLLLLVSEILPASCSKRPMYGKLLAALVILSYVLIFTFAFGGYNMLSNLFSIALIFTTYLIAWKFIRDIRQSNASKTVRLLSISAFVCLILSSIGHFTLAYLFETMSLNALLYRDALFTYLHLQYNGFFTLSIFALLFHNIENKLSSVARKNAYRFSVWLCISIIPSLFLSYLWQDPNIWLRILAIIGSISVFICLAWFIIFAYSALAIYKKVPPVVRHLGLISISAFTLKLFLQFQLIYPPMANIVFGDRPVIIGFLHLVFLVFVTLFLLAYFSQKGFLNMKSAFTKGALILFTTGVILNEAVLMLQGFEAMLIKGSFLFPWALWIIAIILFSGALLLTISRFKYRKM